MLVVNVQGGTEMIITVKAVTTSLTLYILLNATSDISYVKYKSYVRVH